MTRIEAAQEYRIMAAESAPDAEPSHDQEG
jgi:hypothetical protein